MTHIGYGCTGNSFLHHLIGICGVIDGTYRYSRELLALDACRGSPTVAMAKWSASHPISTPLHPLAWSQYLQAHPDQQFVNYLLRGIQEGFRVGMERSITLHSSRRNHPSVRLRPSAVEDYLTLERKLGRFSPQVPAHLIQNCHVSPLGLVPKSQPGKWRLITDLSSPRHHSINDGISPDLCSLQYCKVDDAIQLLVMHGANALMCKVDLQSAYRVVPIHPEDRPLLGVKWDGKVFLDMALPFGLRSAPKIFSALADALAWIAYQHGVALQIHYLDDFFMVGPSDSPICKHYYHSFLQCCHVLGVPIAMNKLVPPCTMLTFLGIEIDSARLQCRLPAVKLRRLQSLIATWQGRHSCKKRDLQSLVGHLNHAAKVVKPGRSFLRRMIDLLPIANQPDHYIRLNAAFRADLLWWATFIEDWNGISMIPRHGVTLHVTSDASGSWGCGAFCDTHWFQLPWPCSWAETAIMTKELAPIVLASMLWGHQWQGKRVQFNCDNMAVVSCLLSGSSKDPATMHLLRCLWLITAFYQFDLHATHIPGKLNLAADALSRNNLSCFLSLFPQASWSQTRIPPQWVDLVLVRKSDWMSPGWMHWLKSSLTRV